MRAHIATILIASMLVGAPAWAQSVESIDSAVAAFERRDFQGCLEILDRMERRLGKSPRKESLRVLALRDAGRYRDAYASLLTYLQLTSGQDLAGNQAHSDMLELRNWLRVQLNAETAQDRERRLQELQRGRDQVAEDLELQAQRQSQVRLQRGSEGALSARVLSLLSEFNPDEALRLIAAGDAGSDQRAGLLRIRALQQIADRQDYRDESVMRSIESELSFESRASAGSDTSTQQLFVDLASYGEYRPGIVAYDRKDYTVAYEHFVRAAGSGNGRAMGFLAQILYEGLGVPRDNERALEWVRRGLSVDDTLAIYLTGVMHYEGRVGSKDVMRALQWFERSAAKGYPPAHAWLGHLYYLGDGIPRDYSMSRNHFEVAARQGHVESIARLADFYEHGRGIEKNLTEARRLYERAANQGSVFAMRRLGVIYLEGIGIGVDMTSALSWFEKAAERGDLGSMRRLGQFYQFGWATQRDYAKAVQWYAPVAETGDLYALLATEGLYASGGHGLEADPLGAATWQERIFSQGGPNWTAPPRHGTWPGSVGTGEWIAPRGRWSAVDAMGVDCKGLINPIQPDLNFRFRGSRHRLVIIAYAREQEQIDTTLVVRGPDGWHCNDNAPGAGTNAAIVIPARTSGIYQVWVGTHRERHSEEAGWGRGVRLFISRADKPWPW